jgi:hypothetical protein
MDPGPIGRVAGGEGKMSVRCSLAVGGIRYVPGRIINTVKTRYNDLRYNNILT